MLAILKPCTRAQILPNMLLSLLIGLSGLTLAFPAKASDRAGHENREAGFGVRLGGMMTIAPAYEGSEKVRVIALPMILPKMELEDTRFAWLKSRIAMNSLDDMRFKALNTIRFEAGPLLGYHFGRKTEDSNRLSGLNDIEGSLIAGAFLGYKVSYLTFEISYHGLVSSNTSGNQFRLGTRWKLPISNRLLLTGGLGTSWADDDYMHTFFSVSNLQTNQSLIGLAAYDSNAGFKDIYLKLGAKLKLSRGWELRTSLRYVRLLSKAADSPLVETPHQFFGSVGMSYAFTWN